MHNITYAVSKFSDVQLSFWMGFKCFNSKYALLIGRM